MKRLSVFVLSAVLAMPSFAAFEDTETGPRASALGGAFVAQADDVNAFYYNPACTVGVPRYELSASHENLFAGLTDNSALTRSFFTFGAPLRFGGKYYGAAGIGWNTLALSGLYTEGAMTLNYAYPVLPSLWAGININRLTVTYGSDEYTKLNPVFDSGYSKSAMGFDIGILRRWENVDLGVSILNLNAPDLGLKYQNKVDQRINAGFSYRQEESIWNGALVLAGKDYRIKTGIERMVLKKLLNNRAVVRGGLSFGSRDYRNMALGLGWRDRSYSVDYSFIYPFSGIAETYGSHLLGVSFGWGEPMSRPGVMAAEQAEQTEVRESAGKGEDSTDTAAVTEARKQAHARVVEAKDKIATGYYSEALTGLTEADRVLKNDPETKTLLARVAPIAALVPSATGGQQRNTLLRKSVNKYMMNDADAVNIITYASQIMPNDVTVGQVKQVITKSFPESMTAQRYLPGISVVDQLLQEALDLIRGGRFIQSVATLEKVLEIEPNNITALTRMGSAYWAMGKKDLARKTWKRVLELDPDNKEVLQFMQ
jgi:Flp pilus assembly protein TadD